MIVAGLGYRSGVDAAEIVALIERALAAASLHASALGGLATPADRADADGFRAAAELLRLPAFAVSREALAAAAPQCRTVSARAQERYGVGSLAEAAALAGAGLPARLLVPRLASARATCAIAEGARR